MDDKKQLFSRGDMVTCNYAPGETAVGEVICYTPNGDIEVMLSITKKRTKTVDKVQTTLKPSQVTKISLLYLDSEIDEDDEDCEEE